MIFKDLENDFAWLLISYKEIRYEKETAGSYAGRLYGGNSSAGNCAGGKTGVSLFVAANAPDKPAQRIQRGADDDSVHNGGDQRADIIAAALGQAEQNITEQKIQSGNDKQTAKA